MKLLVIAALPAVAVARPQEYDNTADELRAAGIVRMESVQNEDGSYTYGYETAGEGQESSQDVSGGAELIGDKVGIVNQGTYSFVAKDDAGNDVPVTINWRAGPDGVVMEGDAIPVAPEDPNRQAQEQAYAEAAARGF